MNLGERIYQLRTEKNFSQGDLAEKLDVSRQSVSKWENNTAVPDLDKLIKLCDVFGISLDELTGREKAEIASIPAVQQNPSITSTKIAGFVLLGITILSAVIFLVTAPLAMFLCIPLLLCTIICFKAKKYAWYWCIWAVYLPLQFYFSLGIRVDILHITEALFVVLMTFITYKFLKEVKFNMRKETRLFLFALSIIFTIAYVIEMWFVFYSGIFSGALWFNEWIYAFANSVFIVILGAGMIHSVCLIREVRQKKKELGSL